MGQHTPNITTAYVRQHAPAGSQGQEAALVDIAQDLLLRDLHEKGLLEFLVFKGGTALRKLYAGAQGRFSLDLDFSVRRPGDDPEAVQQLIAEAVQGLVLGPFTYGIVMRRGKPTLTVQTPLGTTGTLHSKLDVSPPPWLAPTARSWVPMPVHRAYGGPLPRLPCVALEENIAEKIARLNRTTTARDVYDLVWLRTTFRDGAASFDTRLVRRLAVLKIWVDAHGLSAEGTTWKPGHEARSFNPDLWLRTRSKADFDVQDIGQLTVPAPDLDALANALAVHYAFLKDLDGQERHLAAIQARDRPLVLKMIADLPGSQLADVHCW